MLLENAVKPGTLGLFKKIGFFPALADFGLAGGTSLTPILSLDKLKWTDVKKENHN